MTSYEKYVFLLCLIVFTLLTLVFSSLLIILTKQSVRLIYSGAEDDRLIKDFVKTIKRNNRMGWLNTAITIFFACVIAIIFGFSFCLQLLEGKQTTGLPVFRAVYSDSMSDKYKNNTYLFENNLNDQFSRFDLIITYQLPKEEDLQLYDIVVYEVDDVMLIHRIVGIEEPNDTHPNERYFVLQGDLVERPDKFPVLYEQMRAIYRGERIENVGSFVMFLQSPAGYICLLLIVIEMIASPIMEKKIDEAEKNRLQALGLIYKLPKVN